MNFNYPPLVSPLWAPLNNVDTQFGCLFVCRQVLCWFSSKSPNPSPAVSSQAHPMEPHSGQKAGRLILLTFPFSLQCDSLPPGQGQSDPCVFTDWPVTSLPSMLAASCPRPQGWNKTPRPPARLSLCLSLTCTWTLSCVHRSDVWHPSHEFCVRFW